MKAPTIDEYIEESASRLVPEELPALLARVSLLEKRASKADPSRHPRLRAQAVVLTQLFSSFPVRKLSQTEAELAVGALYLLKGYDLIPDNIKPIGFDDDAMLLDRVFERNRTSIEALAGDWISAAAIQEALP